LEKRGEFRRAEEGRTVAGAEKGTLLRGTVILPVDPNEVIGVERKGTRFLFKEGPVASNFSRAFLDSPEEAASLSDEACGVDAEF